MIKVAEVMLAPYESIDVTAWVHGPLAGRLTNWHHTPMRVTFEVAPEPILWEMEDCYD